MKKIVFTFVLLVCAVVVISGAVNSYAETDINGFDFSEYIDELGVDCVNDYVDFDIKERMLRIINGDFMSFDELAKSVADLLSLSFIDMLPSIISVMCICIVTSIIKVGSKNSLISKGVDDVVHFVGLGAVIVILFRLVVEIYSQTCSIVSDVAAFVGVAMPPLLTLLDVIGGTVTSGICRPAVVVLSSGIVELIKSVVMPLSLSACVFCAVGCMSDSIRIGKASVLLKNTSEYVAGVVFMLFSAFMTVEGIASGSVDSVGIRAVKFATKNYLPVLGGYLADGFDTAFASVLLVKNAYGVVVLVAMFIMLLSVVLRAISVNVLLQIASAVLEPVADSKYISMFGKIGKIVSFWAVLLLSICFMSGIVILISISTGKSLL